MFSLSGTVLSGVLYLRPVSLVAGEASFPTADPFFFFAIHKSKQTKQSYMRIPISVTSILSSGKISRKYPRFGLIASVAISWFPYLVQPLWNLEFSNFAVSKITMTLTVVST